MIVTAWCNGISTYGIRVGIPNRRQYFEENRWTEIQVEMDGIINIFSLTDGFWKECPEFRDKRKPLIKNWLKKYKTLKWPKGVPPKMELIQLEGNQFKLVP